MSSEQYEVVIIGAGPVGLFTAVKLAKAGIAVAVLEKEAQVLPLPRACGYWPIVQQAFHEAGVYDVFIKEGGFRTTGIDWRLMPEDDGTGAKKPGRLIASLPREDPLLPFGPPSQGTLNLAQPRLCELLAREAIKAGARVLFSHELQSIIQRQDEQDVVLGVKEVASGEEKNFQCRIAVGADGARSKVRNLLGIPFGGHTWPETMMALDVWLENYPSAPDTTTYLLDEVHYTVLTPLSRPLPGEKSLWRMAYALDPSDKRPREELLSDSDIVQQLERAWVGPRPLPFWKTVNRATYTIHQRLASTLVRGRVVLAGDAAHLCNPIGALGLSTGLLDAVTVYDAIVMILRENHDAAEVLQTYSHERRRTFQSVVDPVSTYNKLRLQRVDLDTVAEDDWYFAAVNDLSSGVLLEHMKRFTEGWQTDMRKAMAVRGQARHP